MNRRVMWISAFLMIFSQGINAQELRTAEGYRIPSAQPQFEFPRDHGSHPEFRIEWWYITGHLRAQDNRRFGFQATFFRYALHPHAMIGDDSFGTNQLYMAHMALSDIEGEKFYHEERLNREGWDAGASVSDMDMFNGNWSLRRTDGEAMQLVASIQADILMSLQLNPEQPKVLFGDEGLSRKGAERSACSWYITFPRLAVEGKLEVEGEGIDVKGEAWMDHEISSSQLGREQVGWDWLSVRFNDGHEMMVYILRDKNGQPDPYSTLAWIEPDGTLHQAGPETFSWTSEGSWKSPETGAEYPIDVRLKGKRPDGTPFNFSVKPLMRKQEMVGKIGGVSYWEGACDIYEEGQNIGEAYMELTGYDESLNDSLN